MVSGWFIAYPPVGCRTDAGDGITVRPRCMPRPSGDGRVAAAVVAPQKVRSVHARYLMPRSARRLGGSCVRLGYGRGVIEPSEPSERSGASPSTTSWGLATGSARSSDARHGHDLSRHRFPDRSRCRGQILRPEVATDRTSPIVSGERFLPQTVLRHPNIVACLDTAPTGTRLPGHGPDRRGGPGGAAAARRTARTVAAHGSPWMSPAPWVSPCGADRPPRIKPGNICSPRTAAPWSPTSGSRGWPAMPSSTARTTLGSSTTSARNSSRHDDHAGFDVYGLASAVRGADRAFVHGRVRPRSRRPCPDRAPRRQLAPFAPRGAVALECGRATSSRPRGGRSVPERYGDGGGSARPIVEAGDAAASVMPLPLRPPRLLVPSLRPSSLHRARGAAPRPRPQAARCRVRSVVARVPSSPPWWSSDRAGVLRLGALPGDRTQVDLTRRPSPTEVAGACRRPARANPDPTPEPTLATTPAPTEAPTPRPAAVLRRVRDLLRHPVRARCRSLRASRFNPSFDIDLARAGRGAHSEIRCADTGAAS